MCALGSHDGGRRRHHAILAFSGLVTGLLVADQWQGVRETPPEFWLRTFDVESEDFARTRGDLRGVPAYLRIEGRRSTAWEWRSWFAFLSTQGPVVTRFESLSRRSLPVVLPTIMGPRDVRPGDTYAASLSAAREGALPWRRFRRVLRGVPLCHAYEETGLHEGIESAVR